MNSRPENRHFGPTVESQIQSQQFVQRFAELWKQGIRPAISEFLPDDDRNRLAVLRDLVQIDVEYRCKSGELPLADEYVIPYPELRLLDGFVNDLQSAIRCFDSDLAATKIGLTTGSAQCVQSTEIASAQNEHPERIGRYRVLRVLGKGGFGTVYLAFDEPLQRQVAVKVPHRHLVSRPELGEAYLTEARTIASLDHENIVPVHDVGSMADYPCFIVSKFVDGEDLATRIKRSRLNIQDVVSWVASIAEALHYAHKRGLVHRDVKPGNILIDRQGTPFVVDFGLALRENEPSHTPQYAGTPAYMSPEQARGEGNRVDGRSDIFSLAIVFYEMLTGRRPFSGQTQIELLESIATREPKPPRQWDDSIPQEVERVCLRALSKRMSDRYTTAKDMADELREFQSQANKPTRPEGPSDNLLHAIWQQLDPQLQDAFSLAYNKKVREGSTRISTKDLFQALSRISDESLQSLIGTLPAASMPEPAPMNVPVDDQVLKDNPLLSDCIEGSLSHFATASLPRKLSPVDIFVDIGKHGHGPSVARLRANGVTAEDLERRVNALGLNVMNRESV